VADCPEEEVGLAAEVEVEVEVEVDHK